MKNEIRKFLVVGLGSTGESCVRFLCGAGHDVIAVDSRDLPPQLSAVREMLAPENIYTGGFPSGFENFEGTAVVSPGISLENSFVSQLRANGVELCSDIELFGQAADAPVLAITGSNGKSTVTTLLAEVLQAAGKQVRSGGNLGTPALDLLQQEKPDYYALELSSFQLDLTNKLDVEIGCVLNVSADHLDRYQDIGSYAAAKERLFSYSQQAVINRDDPIVTKMASKTTYRMSFGLNAPANEFEAGVVVIENKQWLCIGDHALLPLEALRIRGKHNVLNALAVVCFAELLKVPHKIISEVFARYAGLPHRMQWVANSNGVTWLNDSKGTNVGATLAALEGLPGPIILIAGGDAKGADFSVLAKVAENKVRAAIVFGKDAEKLATSFQTATTVREVDDISQAVQAAHSIAQEGDTVLLSPACSSLDMFSGFAQRGEVFMQAVHEVTS